MLFPNEKKGRPILSYKIEEGSVRHSIKTTLQTIIGFNALLLQIKQHQSIDFLELQTANAIEAFQKIAVEKNYVFSIYTSLDEDNKLSINKDTQFYRMQTSWVDAEFYFYGKITNMGGKEKANFHIVTPELGTVLIQTPKEFLEGYETNPLYKQFGIRATGKQNIETGEIDKLSLRFLEIVDYNPIYDEKYLQKLRTKAKQSWQDITDTDKWLQEVRGSYNA